MDNSLHQQETDTQQSPDSLTSFHSINSFLNWMAGLVKLTEEEQMDAGVYLGDEQMNVRTYIRDESND